MSSTQLPTRKERLVMWAKDKVGRRYERDLTKQPLVPKRSRVLWAENYSKFEGRKMIMLLVIGLPMEFIAIVGLAVNPAGTSTFGLMFVVLFILGWDRLDRHYDHKVASAMIWRLRWFHSLTVFDEEDVVIMGGVRNVPCQHKLVVQVVTSVLNQQLKELQAQKEVSKAEKERATKNLKNVEARLKDYEAKYGKFELNEVERSLVGKNHPRKQFLVLSNDALAKHLGENPQSGSVFPFGWRVRHAYYMLGVFQTKITEQGKPVVFVVDSPYTRWMIAQQQVEQYGLLDRYIAQHSMTFDYGSKWQDRAEIEKQRGDKFKDLHKRALDAKVERQDSLEAQQATIGGEKTTWKTAKRIILIAIVIGVVIAAIIVLVNWLGPILSRLGGTPSDGGVVPMAVHYLHKLAEAIVGWMQKTL